MSTSEEIIALADEIERVLKDNSCPMPNEYALQRIRFLCSRISGYDDYVAEKARKMTCLASSFFSVRKHENYRGGANAIYSQMNDMLWRIRGQAKNIAANESKD